MERWWRLLGAVVAGVSPAEFQKCSRHSCLYSHRTSEQYENFEAEWNQSRAQMGRWSAAIGVTNLRDKPLFLKIISGFESKTIYK